MASDEDIIIASAMYIIISEAEAEAAEEPPKKRRKRRWWTTSLFKSRSRYRGIDLINDLKAEMEYGMFQNFCRMNLTDFEWLLNEIGPKISKEDTKFREAIPPAERLMLTMRYLATGDSYTSLMYTFKISKQLISRIIPEVCSAIIEALKEYVKMPTTEEEWRYIAENYEAQWNFPHCLGAIDGRHCILQAPIHSGSDYFNYKSQFSIVLLGVADPNYCFLFADVGCQGRISDGGVLKNSMFWKKIQNNELHLPPDDILPEGDVKVPYVFVGDDAFSLSEHLMKGYPVEQKKGSTKRIFNYRLSRARRIVENVFGIMSAVFRVLRKVMLLSPEKATLVVLACVYLHNFLRKSKHSRKNYTPPGTFDEEKDGKIIPGLWRQGNENRNAESFLPIPKLGRKSSVNCEAIRNTFALYFMGEGSVSWQNTHA